MSDVDHSRDAKARKDYICMGCRRLIPKGTKYHYHRELNYGEWETYKCHIECKNMHAAELDEAAYHLEQMEENEFDWNEPLQQEV